MVCGKIPDIASIVEVIINIFVFTASRAEHAFLPFAFVAFGNAGWLLNTKEVLVDLLIRINNSKILGVVHCILGQSPIASGIIVVPRTVEYLLG